MQWFLQVISSLNKWYSFFHSTTDNVPDLLDRVKIKNPGRPWKCGYRLAMQVICHNTTSVGSGVVIHKDRSCIQRIIVKVRHNTCFKDVLPIDLSIEVASYCNEVKLTVIWYTSHTMTDPPPKGTVSTMLRSAVFGCRHTHILSSVTCNKKQLSSDQ